MGVRASVYESGGNTVIQSIIPILLGWCWGVPSRKSELSQSPSSNEATFTLFFKILLILERGRVGGEGQRERKSISAMDDTAHLSGGCISSPSSIGISVVSLERNSLALLT